MFDCLHVCAHAMHMGARVLFYHFVDIKAWKTSSTGRDLWWAQVPRCREKLMQKLYQSCYLSASGKCAYLVDVWQKTVFYIFCRFNKPDKKLLESQFACSKRDKFNRYWDGANCMCFVVGSGSTLNAWTMMYIENGILIISSCGIHTYFLMEPKLTSLRIQTRSRVVFVDFLT